ncbi:uncharacterized protein BHQ10_009540 [Talaromyces amestolkiae]|uniref:NmrA-like domain-containing protein n=1 Tax=Talaromyces amestolkiae TaxID=1196081 RepID=A0A364LCJ3_TALAM|nr:uncharacterized protein BHQ10_009540 [Talaromyces amestolkiae]RAO73528.1 hypothetical protein BHQ10_009540 [Talaromyces amestolkiae]
MTFKNVALVGASGQLGQKILRHLLASPAEFRITVLQRQQRDLHQSKYDMAGHEANVRVKVVDYENHEILVSALRDVDVIVSALDSVTAIRLDRLLLEAGRAAGARRMFPSEYTLDVLHPAAVALMGEAHPRVQHARLFDALAQVSDDETAISSTTIVSGMFLDFAMKGHHGNYDLDKYSGILFDGGDVPATGCSSDFIAASVVAALRMPEELTRNKRIHIAEMRYTGRHILQALEVATDTKFSATYVSSEFIQKKLTLAIDQGLEREIFVLPVVLLNFASTNEASKACGAGYLETGLDWNAGGFLTQERKTLLEIAREVVQAR